MKNLLSLVLVSLISIMSWSCSDDDEPGYEVSITYNDLPSLAQDFIQTYYPDNQILAITNDVSSPTSVYDVEFVNGADVEFNSIGQWTSVEAPDGMAIPEGIVPVNISDYVNLYYPAASINEIEQIIPSGYEVTLTTGLDLIFNQDGTLLTSYD